MSRRCNTLLIRLRLVFLLTGLVCQRRVGARLKEQSLKLRGLAVTISHQRIIDFCADTIVQELLGDRVISSLCYPRGWFGRSGLPDLGGYVVDLADYRPVLVAYGYFEAGECARFFSRQQLVTGVCGYGAVRGLGALVEWRFEWPGAPARYLPSYLSEMRCRFPPVRYLAAEDEQVPCVFLWRSSGPRPLEMPADFL